MENIVENLKRIAGEGAVLVDEPMSAHTTFRVGGPADYLVAPESAEAVRDIVLLCEAEGLEWRILGHGSNVLVADAGLRGVTVQISSNLSDVDVRGDVVEVQAGASNAKVAACAAREALSGYEFAAGIPGTVGGAAIMNAGAYDGEFRQVAESVVCLRPQGQVVRVEAAQAGWSYRHSDMMDDGSIVLSATLRLKPGDPDKIRERMAELARRRQEKQPVELPSAGSTFKRPPGHFAGKLIQDAGLGGYAVGGAQVSTKHAGFVVNTGGATAADVLAVIRDVQARVLDRFGVQLVPEVRLWGFE
jgi:UDP-N-acetylmuramate dehydrogenase